MPTIVETLRNISSIVPSNAPAPVNLTIRPLGDRLIVEIVFDEGQWVAVEGFTGMFGEGDTKDEAFADVVRGLFKLRAEFAAHRDSLSDRLRDRLAALEAVIGNAA